MLNFINNYALDALKATGCTIICDINKILAKYFGGLKNSLLICAIKQSNHMQTGKVSQSYRIESLHPAFKRLFDFVKTTDFSKLPLGKNEIDGEDLFIMNLDIDGADITVQPLEMHRKYIDVHILLGGTEKIGWKPVEEIEHFTKLYEEDGDCALSDDAPRYYVELVPGEYCIVFPEDTHAPAISNGKIRKLIGKVKL